MGQCLRDFFRNLTCYDKHDDENKEPQDMGYMRYGGLRLEA